MPLFTLRPARLARAPRAAAGATALALCTALTGLAGSTAALAAEAPAALTLHEALRLAPQRSQQLVAHDAAARAARERSVAAGQRPDPTLRAGVANLPIDGADRYSLTRDFMTMRTIGVMQELTRSDKLRARSARYDREAEAAEAARALALALLRRDTALAWLERHFAERLLELLREQRAESALQIDGAEALYRGGRGSQADVFAARTAVEQIDDRLRWVETEIAVARTQLARWIGADAERPLAAPPDGSHARLGLGTLDAALERHPQIGLLARQEAVARAEADMARTDQRADWSVELMLAQRGSAYSNMASVSVAIPLQWNARQRQDREVSARLALAEQARAQREEATREALAQARGWLQTWHGQRGRLAAYDRSLIPLARERTQSALAAYRGGGATLTGVLEARRMEIELRIDRLRLEKDTAGLWAQLETLLPEGAP